MAVIVQNMIGLRFLMLSITDHDERKYKKYLEDWMIIPIFAAVFTIRKHYIDLFVNVYITF